MSWIYSQPNKTGDWGSVIKPLFLKQNLISARFIVLTLLCLSILFIFREHPRVTAVQRGAVDVVAFTSNIVVAPFDAWDRLLESMRSRNALRDEVLRLQQENRVLKGQAQRLASLLSENARYKALLNSARDIEDELIAAQISSVSPDPARHLVMLDKGAADGVEEGQPVLGVEGLIGQIVLVDENNSRALLITDSAHALPVQVNRSGLRAIAEGSGDIDRLVIRHLAATTDIKAGDLLVTSGLGGRFPHGYPVARVTDVEIAAGDAFAVVSAAPASALDRGRHVLVVAQSSQFEGAAAP